ncbi:MFS transporter [Cronobacter turicensis]|uniref:MFS transporter n=1 Tax=Cronobacter turicensis TaxID=413502 RepID=UPI0024AE851D|nr:MFS transporter [Cronobacter turicensis]ELY4677687.1 MFS transporter [Cronobacter turicensis]ELY6319753.1 MFS transporter [Cronobacter turicensis]ELY7426875.1 MFS transporter [Cronobacter turicensis]MDI6433068.1 MFS transporter [Cronobacter turicensis]
MAATISSKNKIALSAVCLSAIMLGLEITSIPSILPTLEKMLPAEFSQLQWIMNAYTLAMCSCLVAMGALADRFGRKRIFLGGIAVFGIASLICGMASSAPVLISARFLQGASAAAMLSCQVAVLSHQFRDGPERGVAFGWWGIMFGLGLGFGPVIGGGILALLSWHWVFLIHVVIAVVTVFAARMGVVESSDPHVVKIDLGGIITLPIAVFGFVYLITQGHELSLASGKGLEIIAISIASLLLFIIIELKSQRPIFDFKAFRICNFSIAMLGASGMNFSFWPFVIYFPLYLQSVLGYSSVEAGLIVLAYTLPTIVVPPYAERLLQKRGPGFIIPVGLFTIAIGFALLHVTISSGHASWLTLLPGCLIAGVGLGLTNTPVTNTSTGSLPPERAGMASGMEFSARMISLAVNIAVMGFVLLSGVSAELVNSVNVDSLASVANTIAAGNFNAELLGGVNVATAHDAFVNGISWVTLYGTLAPAILGLLARLISQKKSSNKVVTC